MGDGHRAVLRARAGYCMTPYTGKVSSGMFLLNYYPAASLSRPQIALGGLL